MLRRLISILAYLVYIYIQLPPDLRFARNLVFNVIERFVTNVQMITFAFFLLFQIELKSLDCKYFVFFITLSMKSINIIVFEILLIVLPPGTRKA